LILTKKKLETKEKELNKLEITQKNYERSLKFSVKKVLEKKKDIKGIYGTLISLCTFPTNLTLPIKVALGAYANAIVVENENVAKQCINFLRNNKIGIATFLPLNKIKPRQITRYISNPGLVGYAFDIVHFDKKFENVFALALFDTIIVKDFETAKSIGFNRNKMVTLKGDLITKSGAVTGGFRKTSSNLEQINTKLIAVKKTVMTYHNKLSELDRSIKQQNKRIVHLKEDRSALQAQLNSINKSINECKKNLDNAERFEHALNEIKILEQEKESLEKQISELEKIKEDKKITAFYENLKREINDLSIKFNSVDTQLSEVFIPEIKRLENSLINTTNEINSLRDSIKNNSEELRIVESELNKKEKTFLNISKSIEGLYNKQKRLRKRIDREKKSCQIKRERIEKYSSQIQNKKIILAKKEEQQSNLLESFSEFKGIPLLERVGDVKKREEEIKELESELKRFGSINYKAIEQYDSIKAEFDKIFNKFEVLRKERDDVLFLIDEIEGRKTATFLKTYNEIEKNFRRIFSELTSGVGFLELTNPDSPLDGGLDIRVRTREAKKFTHLRSLSGGEKTVTALAFIFAIQEYFPTPFYVFDEIDAALDKENSEKLAKIIKKYSKQAQFIVISHNDTVISEADYLYGVSMNNLGESDIVSLKLPK